MLAHGYPDARVVEFSPYGYDERQLCSPGIDLPVGRLTRSANGGYAQYHSSADDLGFITPQALGQSFRAALDVLEVLDANARYVNLNPHCEPQLGRRGLYRSIGGAALPGRELALLWVLNQSDGTRTLRDIAERAGLAFAAVKQAADDLVAAGLLREQSALAAQRDAEHVLHNVLGITEVA